METPDYIVESSSRPAASWPQIGLASVAMFASLLAGCSGGKSGEPVAPYVAQEPARASPSKSGTMPDQERKVCDVFQKAVADAALQKNPITAAQSKGEKDWRLLDAFHEIMGDSGSFEHWTGTVDFRVENKNNAIVVIFYPNCSEEFQPFSVWFSNYGFVIERNPSVINDDLTIKLDSAISESLKSVTPRNPGPANLVEASGRLFWLRELPPGATAGRDYKYYEIWIPEHANYIGAQFHALVFDPLAPGAISNTYDFAAKFSSIRGVENRH